MPFYAIRKINNPTFCTKKYNIFFNAREVDLNKYLNQHEVAEKRRER